MNELVDDADIKQGLQLATVRVLDYVWMLRDVVSTVLFGMEAFSAFDVQEPREAIVTQHALPLLRRTAFADVDQLALAVSSALVELSVPLVPEASHEHVSMCTDEERHCFLAMVA